jgi:hypothetical protein
MSYIAVMMLLLTWKEPCCVSNCKSANIDLQDWDDIYCLYTSAVVETVLYPKSTSVRSRLAHEGSNKHGDLLIREQNGAIYQVMWEFQERI